MENADVPVCRMKKPHQLSVFQPASKMNNGKEQEKRPLVPEQTGTHYKDKKNGGKRTGFKSLPVECHYSLNVNFWGVLLRDAYMPSVLAFEAFFMAQSRAPM